MIIHPCYVQSFKGMHLPRPFLPAVAQETLLEAGSPLIIVWLRELNHVSVS